MTFFDTLGGLAQGIGDFTGLTDAWHDMASAFTDNGENDNIVNDAGQALRGFARVAVAPVTTTLHAFGQAAQLDQQALHYTTGFAGYLGAIGHSSALHGLGDNWQRPEESFGDYSARAWNSTVGGDQSGGLALGQIGAAGAMGPNSLMALQQNAGTNYAGTPLDWNSAQRDAVFGGGINKFTSGFGDLIGGTVLDPANVAIPAAGKVARAAYAGRVIAPVDSVAPNMLQGAFKERPETLMAELNKGIADPTTGTGKWMQSLADADASQLRQMKYVKRMADPTTAAYLLGEAKSPTAVRDTLSLLYRTLPDAELNQAVSRLVSEHAANGGTPQEMQYLADRILNGQREVSSVVDGLVADKTILDQHSAMVAKELADPSSSLARAYSQTLDRVNSVRAPIANQAPGSNAFLNVDQRISALRSGRYAKAVPTATISQPTRFHPIMAVVDFGKGAADFFTKERTSGFINYHDSDSSTEVAALIDDINRVTGGKMADSGEGRAWLNTYMSAAGEGDRMRIHMAIENRGLAMLAEDIPSLDAEGVRKLWEQSFTRRAKALAQYKTNGFLSYLTDSGDSAIAKIPLLERQNANVMPVLDFGQVATAIRRHSGGVLAAASEYGGLGAAGLDVVNDIFKMSTLFRLGYTVRNVAEAYGSMFVSGYLGNALMSAGRDNLKQWVDFRRADRNRLIDNFAVRTGAKPSEALALHDNALATANLRLASSTLAGIRDAALRPAALNVSEADRLLFERYNAGEALTGDEVNRARVIASNLQNVARLRGETTRAITYHTTNDPAFKTINGDYLDTTPSRGVADAMTGQHYDYHSVEDLGFAQDNTASEHAPTFANPEGGRALATVDAQGSPATQMQPERVTVAGHRSTPAASTPRTRAERDAAVGALLNQAERALSRGKYVEYRTPTGWQPLTQSVIDAKRAVRMKDGEFVARPGDTRMVLRSRDAAAAPSVRTIPSYGAELDLTHNVNQWPTDLMDSLSPEARIAATQGDFNNPALAKAMVGYAKGNGVGRIILPNKEWGQTVRVIKDTVDGYGGKGSQPIAERNIDALIKELQDSTQARVLPEERTAAQNRAARKALRKNKDLHNTAKQATNGVPVVPNYDANHIQMMLDQGIIPALHSAIQDVADHRALAEAARTQLAGVRERQKAMQKVGTSGTGKYVIHTDLGPQEVPEHFAGTAGDIYRRATSGDATNDRLVGNGMENLGTAIPSANPVRVEPNDPNYFQSWANMLNWHWRDPATGNIDPVVDRLLSGQHPDEVARWLTSTKDGRAYADRFNWGTGDGETSIPAIVHHLSSAIQMYLPTPEVRQVWRQGDLTAEWLNKAMAGRTDLHPLMGLLVPQSREWADDNKLRVLMNKSTQKVFHILGSLPETAFARHPLFRAVYNDEMSKAIPYAVTQKGGLLTTEEVSAIAKMSQETARRKVNQTLFTISRRTGAAQKMRLVFPFYAAWENQFRRWGNFVVNDTEGINKLMSNAARFFNNANLVNSSTGQKGDITKDDINNLSMVLPWRPPDLGEGSFDQRVPISSFDVGFQGQPLNPGLGPFVSLPLLHVMQSKPETEQILGWAFPPGTVPKDELDVFMASSLRRVVSAVQEDQNFVNDANRIMQHELMQYAAGKRSDKPTWSEIEDKTRKFYALKFLTNMAAPYSVQYTNDVNYYTEQMRQYQQTWGQNEGDARFLNDHPEAFVVLQPLSENKSGVRATYASVDNLKKYQDLAAQADAIGDPRMLGWLANYGQGKYDPNNFSTAAYNWELANSPVPGAAAYREKKNPEQIWTDAQVGKGWIQFRQYMDMIQSQLTNYGVDPASAVGIKVTSQVRKAVADAMSQTNQEWYRDYASSDSTRFDKRAEFFQQVVNDPTFLADHQGDGTIQSIAAFLDLRQNAASQLLQNAALGGSKRLGAKSNSDIQTAYLSRINQMKADNLGFADWYDQYFTNDPVVL